jgi:TetR/AcrR family transcriptional repressor of nem operon
MPWEKSFSEPQVVERAMHAFWARGYEATSVQDLVAATGIGRGSIYAAFGDKRGLFLSALRHYDARHRGDWTDGLRETTSPRAAILRAFDQVVDAVIGGRRRDGCLLVNTALELSAHDPEVAGIVADGLRGMERFFADMVREGQARGEIAERLDPGETAQVLLALLAGLRVFSRARPEPDLLRAVGRQAARLLD